MNTAYGDKKLRMGIFGTGWWSRFQIPAWLEIGNIEIAALYNRTVSKAEAVKTNWDLPCRIYGDPEEVFRNEQLDVVDILTETPFHAPLVRLAAKYRVPVICQKPLDYSYETCLELMEQCRRAEIPFLINENYRWQPPFRQVKAMVDGGRIGRPFRAMIQLSTGGPEQLESQPFLKSLRHYALFDLGVHAFDVARYLFGEPDRLYCQTLRSVDYIRGDDVAEAILTYKDLLCRVSISDKFTTKLLVEGPDGTIELTTDNKLKIITREATETLDCAGWKEYNCIGAEELRTVGGTEIVNAVVEAQRNILEELRYGKKAETSISEYIKTMELTFAAIRSGLTGESVVLYRY